MKGKQAAAAASRREAESSREIESLKATINILKRALDHAERRVIALESLASSLATIAAAHKAPEPIAYTVVWEAKDGEKVIDKPPTTLDIARAELADYRARWPEMKHYMVALVPVVAP